MANSNPFTSVVSQMAEAAAIDLSGDWKPAPGEGTWVLTGVDSGVTEKGVAFIRPRFQVADGDEKGRDFSDYFHLDPKQKGQMGIRGAALLASCVAGAEIPQAGANLGQFITKCHEVLQSNIGAVIIGESGVRANKKPKPGQASQYPFLKYSRRIPTS